MTGQEVADEATPLKKRVVRKKQKTSPWTKWIVLSLCCLVMAAMYYILAMPAALHRQLYAIMPSKNFEMNFNLLFTVSYFPNMILPMFGGAVVDKYGEAKCLVAFCGIVFIGQTLTAFGISSISWELMLLGRLVFGLGAQNLIVANASLISKWFAGNEGVALGLSNVFSYGGVIATNVASPHLANSFHPSFAFWLGVGIEGIAIALGLVIVAIDRKKKMPKKAETPLVCSPMFSPVAFTHQHFSPSSRAISSPGGIVFPKREESSSSTGASAFSKIRNFKPTFWLLCASFLLVYGVVWSFTNVSSGILLERDFFLRPPKDCLPKYPDQCTSGEYAPSHENPSFDSQGNECPVGNNVAPVIPKSLNMTTEGLKGAEFFDNNEYKFQHLINSDIQCHDEFWSQACTQDYCEDLAVATEKAGFYMSIPYFFTVALTSLLGVFVDKTGWRTEMICLGSTLLILAHVLLAYPLSSPPVVPLVGQGLGYTICVAALWPSVPFTVSPDSVGIAFGIMMGVQNVGLALIPLVVALLYKLGDKRYLPHVEIFFAACSLLAAFVGVALMMVDKKTDKILGTPKINIHFDKENETLVLDVPRRLRSNSDALLLEKKRTSRS